MGCFEFECERGHVTELFVSLAERPAFIKCEHAVEGQPCQLPANLVLSATPTTFRQNDRKAFKRQGH
jgi:hypothetical protein